MSSHEHSSAGNDESLSSSKIPPLDSPMKSHFPHADSHGVIGTDDVIESSHLPPFREHAQTQGKHRRQSEQSVDSSGSVGKAEMIGEGMVKGGSAKLESSQQKKEHMVASHPGCMDTVDDCFDRK